MSLLQQVASGTFWTALGTYLNLILSLFVTAILARLLTPSDFGVVGMVYVYSGFVSLIANSGLNSAVVQRQDLSPNDLATVFWYSLGLSGLLLILSVLLAPSIEAFYQYPGLAPVISVMSLNLLFLGLSNVPSGVLRKNLRFKAIATIDIASALLGGGSAILFALHGFGYWALVLQALIFSGLKAVLYLFFCHWKPTFSFRWPILRSVFGYSNYLLGFSSINYWARNADNLLIGKYLGAAELGYYNQAYKLMTLPIRLITNAVTPSLHPVFAKAQNDLDSVRTTYFRVLEIIALFSFSLGTFFLVCGDVVIRILWGDKFLASIPIFKVLALLTMFQPIVSTSGSIFMACNKAPLLFKLGSFNAFVMVLGICLGLPRGAVGVAIGYASFYLIIVLPITFLFLLKTIKAKLTSLWQTLRKPIFIAVCLLLTSFVFRLFLFDKLSFPTYSILCILQSCLVLALVSLAVYFQTIIYTTKLLARRKFYVQKNSSIR